MARPAALACCVFGVCLLVCAAGCSSGTGGGGAPDPGPSADPREAAARNGFTRVLGACGPGFLAEMPGSGPPSRRLLYLEGTHAQMGYQAALLCPEEVQAMVMDNTDGFLFDMLELPFTHEDLGPPWDLFRAGLTRRVAATDRFVPERFRQEMQGLVEGLRDARAQGRLPEGPEVTYGDVLLLNQGVDVLLALSDALAAGARAGLACNQFACWGPHTADGRLFHGRDFQYYTAGVYQNAALLSVFRPLDADGNAAGHPFVSISAPGFVGQATGMNSRGIGLGINLETAWAADAVDFGLGGLLLMRQVLEEAGSREEAAGIFRRAPRGCPWIFVISDARGRTATVLETLSSFPPAPWMQERLAWSEALASGLLGEPFTAPFPSEGVLERPADHVPPSRYAGKGVFIPGYCNDPAFPGDHTLLNFRFSDPGEDSPFLVAAANHYLRPELTPFEWGMPFSRLFLPVWSDTQWRYETHVKLLLDLSTGGRTMDREAAWRAIDFLNPRTPDGAFYWGPDPDQQVHGHVALMDGEALWLRARFGYYGQEPVDFCFGRFVP